MTIAVLTAWRYQLPVSPRYDRTYTASSTWTTQTGTKVRSDPSARKVFSWISLEARRSSNSSALHSGMAVVTFLR